MIEKLKVELAEAKREIEKLKEVQSIITESNKEEAEFTRLVAFKNRVRGITEADIDHILTFTTAEECAAAVLALIHGKEGVC